MRRRAYTRGIVLGLMVAGALTLALPDLVFSGGRSFRRGAKFRLPAMHRVHGFSGSFHHSGFLRNHSGFLDNKSGLIFVNGFDFFARPLHSGFFGIEPGFFGVSGLGGTQVVDGGGIIIIQHVPSSGPSRSAEPTKDRTYVYPQWVDAGHGVEVLSPGYWMESKAAPQ